MLYFIYRYNRKRHPHAVQIKDNNLLEITWITIPLILVILMFYYGYVAFSPMRDVPKDAIPITVIGKMWSWTFEYEGGKQSPVLVVPLNKAVKLNLYSPDVIHSLYIPAFRIKEDVVPGKQNYMWFIGQQLGEYDVLCTVYCGLRHSYMETKTRVVTEAEYAAWLKALPEKSSEPEGLVILKKNACTGCHSIDGSKIVSTSFKGLYGKTEKVVTNGKERTVTVDDDYLRASVFDPDKDLVAGYQKGIMKTYKGIVTEDEMTRIIEYFKSIK
jgi:cytochrome c oxidase subunit 2